MHSPVSNRSPREVLTINEVEKFRALVRECTGVSLTLDDANSAALQLLRALWHIREMALRARSTIPAASVENADLPASGEGVMNTPSPT